MRKLSNLFFFSLILMFAGCNEYSDLDDGLYAEFETNKGSFVAELFFEQTPLTVANFVSLAEGTSSRVNEEYQGERFYDGIVFHRIIEDFMIQGGDPTGTGTGGPGYEFPDEIVDTLRHDSKGILSMANSGPGTNGSQFFITLKETPWLNGLHTVFGEVVAGQEVVDSIGTVETSGANKPINDVVLEKVNIIRKGDAAENFNADQVFSQELENLEAKAAEEERQKAEQRAASAQEFDQMKAEAEELDSGLQIVFNEKGDGEKPDTGDMVLVNYAGYLTDGTLFDSNIEEVAKERDAFNPQRKAQGGYQPIPMPYSPDAQMIPGFKEGIQNMRVGDKATLFIPSHLGYGEAGAGDLIPPNTDLIFQVELVGIQE